MLKAVDHICDHAFERVLNGFQLFLQTLAENAAVALKGRVDENTPLGAVDLGAEIDVLSWKRCSADDGSL